MKKRIACLAVAAACGLDLAGLLATQISPSPSPGGLDASFRAAPVNGRIESTALQSDGKILIGGVFTAVQQTSCPGLARLNPDGTLDLTFAPEIEFWPGLSNQVKQIIVEPNDKILLGGLFTLPGTASAVDLARLRADGSLDASFQPRVITNITGTNLLNLFLPPISMVRQSDGKIVVAAGDDVWADFTGYVHTQTIRISRYHSDGAADSAYPELKLRSIPDPVLKSALLLPDDSMVLMGSGLYEPGLMRGGSLMKFDSDGRFTPYGVNLEAVCSRFGCDPPIVSAGLAQPDGKLIISGSFWASGIYPDRGQYFRLAPDGQADFTFQTQAHYPSLVLRLHDGTLLVTDYWSDPAHPAATVRSDILDKNGMPLSPWEGRELFGLAAEQADGDILVTDGDRTLTRIFGPDRTPRAPSIVEDLSPVVISNALSETWTILPVRARGYPLHFQWSLNGVVLPGATNSTVDVTGKYGRFTATASNELGSATSSELVLNPPAPPASLPTVDEALNVPGWHFETPVEHGRYTWSIGQWIVSTNPTHDGYASLGGFCANYSNDQYTSRLRTTITGPGVLRYWTTGSDSLVFQVGTNLFDYYHYDSTNWVQRAVPIPPGPATLTWQPVSTGIQMGASAYLDEIVWQPAPAASPWLSFSPAEVVVRAGLSADLRISPTGPGATGFQWHRGKSDATYPVIGVMLDSGWEPLHLLPGFNRDTMHLPRVTEADAGFYLVTAQLENGGTTCSDLLKLSVTNTPALQLQFPAPGRWELVWSDAAKGMSLQQSPTLVPAHWQSIQGSELADHFELPLSTGTRFFRLAKP